MVSHSLTCHGLVVETSRVLIEPDLPYRGGEVLRMSTAKEQMDQTLNDY